MSETARQDKARAWSLTIFDPGEYAILANKESWPHWIRETKFQEEVAPTTGKRHWQVALFTQQVRFSALKKIFPSAHIEVARNKDALMNYVEKSDSAVPGTQQHLKNEKEYLALHQQLQRLANVAVDLWTEYANMRSSLYEEKDKNPDKAMYWWIANNILAEEPEMAATLANPALEKMWIHTSGTWIFAAKAASEAISITASPQKIETSGIKDGLLSQEGQEQGQGSKERQEREDDEA